MKIVLCNLIFFLLVTTDAHSSNNYEFCQIHSLTITQSDTIPQKAGSTFDESQMIIDYVELKASINKKLWRRYFRREFQKALKDSSFKGLPMGTYSVLIKFQIDIDGSIKDVQAISNSPIELTKPSIDVIRNGPKWQPAIIRGKETVSYITQAITFVIEKDSYDISHVISYSP